MAYQYCGALYCDSCGEALRDKLRAEGKVPGYPRPWDSGDWPASFDESESDADSISHCDSGAECLEPVALSDYGLDPWRQLVGAEEHDVGALIEERLTAEGVERTREMLREEHRTPYQHALHRLWSETYPELLDDDDGADDDDGTDDGGEDDGTDDGAGE